jgi:hypothetical protein
MYQAFCSFMYGDATAVSDNPSMSFSMIYMMLKAQSCGASAYHKILICVVRNKRILVK